MAKPSTPPASPGQALRTLRVIGIAMALGVTLFAGVVTVLHATGGAPPADESTASLISTVMVVVAVGAVIAALVLWRARVAPLIERPTTGDWRARAASIQTGVIIVWALVEGASLFAEVVYLLHRDLFAGVLGLGLFWAALGLTWPRAEWLGADRSAG